MVKNPPANAGDLRDAIRSLGREDPLVEGMAPPLQYSCLENPMDRGASQATVRKFTQSWTRLKQLSMHACIGFLSFPTSLRFLLTLAFLGLRSQINW